MPRHTASSGFSLLRLLYRQYSIRRSCVFIRIAERSRCCRELLPMMFYCRFCWRGAEATGEGCRMKYFEGLI